MCFFLQYEAMNGPGVLGSVAQTSLEEDLLPK